MQNMVMLHVSCVKYSIYNRICENLIKFCKQPEENLNREIFFFFWSLEIDFNVINVSVFFSSSF